MPDWRLLAAFGASTVGVLAAGFALGARSRRDKARPGGDPPSASADQPTGAPAIGQTIAGRYRLVREIGRGSTGIVHLAVDLPRGTQVALKTLSLPAGQAPAERDETLRRFAREADIAKRLRHPDIVDIEDAGEAFGVAYIAMEVLGGADLARHTRADALLPVEPLLRIVARIALALDHAHRQGVVHRDIKPANIVWDPVADTVKITDFGVAHLAEAERTRTGVLLGTPLYSSPEQLAGGRIDGRSDLFSLAVMLHELLTGSLPYRPGPVTADLLRQIAAEPPPSLRSRRPGLPSALDDLMGRALQKRPSERHPDGRAFAAALLDIADRMRLEGPHDVG